MGEKETMKIEKLNYTLNTNPKQKIYKHARFDSIEQAQPVFQAKSSYETSGSMGKVDRNLSISLRHMYANGKIGKVSKTPYAIISFGAKNKKHQVFVGAEMPPYCKIGGVATVMDDYKIMCNDDKDNRKVMIIPYYNGKIETNEKGYPTGKISVHTFPEGTKDKYGNDISNQPFYTNADLYSNSEEDIIKSGNYKILEKVGADEKMAFGFKTESIALFRVKDTNHFMVFNEATAAMPKPYTTREKIGEGSGKAKKTGYASTSGGINNGWDGDPYAKFNKAVVQLLPRIQYTYDKYGKQENTKFEPATIICSDTQTAYISHYMAMSIEDNEYYNDDVHPTYVAHNLGQGYVSKSTYKEMYINLGATKEDLENIQKDEKYLKAAARGIEEEEKYFKKLFHGLKLADDTGEVSGIMVPIHYTKQGYIPILTTVSEAYAKSLVTNESISPGLCNILKGMYDKGQFQGILNAANSSELDPTKRLGLLGYGYSIFKVTNEEGKEDFITSKDLALKDIEQNEEYRNADKDKQAALLEERATYYDEYDKREIIDSLHGYKNLTRHTDAFARYDKVVTDENWESIKEAKAKNKLNFINRLSKDGETNGLLLTGIKGRRVKEIGSLNLDRITNGLDNKKDVIEKLKECHLTVSWGRGDLQKGLDTTMLAWAKYAQHDKNAFLILGGELPEDDDEGDKIIKVIDKLSKDFNGRFVFLNGFAPGLPLSTAADSASFPSRFAPCELTDLEAMHFATTPVVTNCQGLQQKNYDPELGDTQDQTSFKTLHEFYMSHEYLIKHDEDIQKAIDWLETKKGEFEGFLEGNVKEGFSYKQGISVEDIYKGRNQILKAYANEKNLITTEEDAEQKDIILKLLQASYEIKTSGFKKQYNDMEQKAFKQAKNVNGGKDVSDEYNADIIKDIRKSQNYDDLVRASRDFIINNEMAMGLIRAKHSIAKDEERKKLSAHALSLNTKLTENNALHPDKKSTQQAYIDKHILGKSTKPGPDQILRIDHVETPNKKPKVSTENNKQLIDKIKEWWNGLSKTAKWGVGIGSAVAAATAIGVGIFAGIKVHQNKLDELQAKQAADEEAYDDEYYDEDDEMIDE